MITKMRLYVVLIGILLALVTSAQVLAQATPTATNSAEFEITGTVDAIGIGTITVNGQLIQIAGAEIKDSLTVGALVKAHLTAVNGALVAREVELALDAEDDFDDDELEIVGTVEAFTADTVTIGGQVIQIAGAEIKARIMVGARLKIHLAVGADGALVAREVELARNTNGVGDGFDDDDGAGHDLNDDHGDDGPGHDLNDDHGGEQEDNSGHGSSGDDDDDHGGHDDSGDDDHSGRDGDDD